MTENESIEALKLEGGIEIKGNPGRIAKFFEALDMAIEALEEIQQYREIGTVEEIKSVKKYIALKRRCGTPTNTIDLCAEYVAIGTVEECREAVEKQKPKTPDYEGDGYADGYMVYDTWICPNCGKQYEVDYDDYDHCPKCGQAIQWDANLEGMEDENT